jgi:hypothetical protein
MKRFLLLLGLAMLMVSLVLENPLSAQAGTAPKEKGTLTYDESAMPIRTQYPDAMQVADTCSGEGCGFIFTFKPQGNLLDQAEVHIFLPKGVATAAAQAPFVTGPRGLLANNGWKKTGAAKNTREFPYRWVKKIISFSDPGNKGMRGKILLGETNGQAVQVILYYPNNLGRKFLANAQVILANLQFKSDKLPLGKSPAVR